MTVNDHKYEADSQVEPQLVPAAILLEGSASPPRQADSRETVILSWRNAYVQFCKGQILAHEDP